MVPFPRFHVHIQMDSTYPYATTERPKQSLYTRMYAFTNGDSNIWDKPNDGKEIEGSILKLKTKLTHCVVIQIVVGFSMLIVSCTSDEKWGWSEWYLNTIAGGKLRDLQYVFSVLTCLCAMLGFYTWTRYWYLYNMNEAKLVQMNYFWGSLSLLSYGLCIWTAISFFLSFPRWRHIINNESADLHSFIYCDMIFLLSYLFLGIHHGLSYFIHYYNVTEKFRIDGTLHDIGIKDILRLKYKGKDPKEIHMPHHLYAINFDRTTCIFGPQSVAHHNFSTLNGHDGTENQDYDYDDFNEFYLSNREGKDIAQNYNKREHGNKNNNKITVVMDSQEITIIFVENPNPQQNNEQKKQIDNFVSSKALSTQEDSNKYTNNRSFTPNIRNHNSDSPLRVEEFEDLWKEMESIPDITEDHKDQRSSSATASFLSQMKASLSPKSSPTWSKTNATREKEGKEEGFTARVVPIPSLEILLKHLSDRSFQIVAAKDDFKRLKVFFCSQYNRIITPLGTPTNKTVIDKLVKDFRRENKNDKGKRLWFLCDLEIDKTTSLMKLNIRAKDKDMISLYTQKLELEQIMTVFV